MSIFNFRRMKYVEIKRLAENAKSVDRIYDVELKDKAGVVHAQIEKTLYIAKKGK